MQRFSGRHKTVERDCGESLRPGSLTTSPYGIAFLVTGPLWGEPPVTGGFPSQRPVTGSFDVFFDVRLNKQLNNNEGAGDLRRHDVHMTVMSVHHWISTTFIWNCWARRTSTRWTEWELLSKKWSCYKIDIISCPLFAGFHSKRFRKVARMVTLLRDESCFYGKCFTFSSPNKISIQLSLLLEVQLLGKHTHDAGHLLFVRQRSPFVVRFKLVGHVVVDTCQEVHDLCVVMTLT